MTDLVSPATPLERRLAGERADAGATPLDAFKAARRRFLRGDRIDMQELAAALGVSRATLYRWVGTRERLIGEVLWSLSELQLQESRASARGRGVDRIVEIYESYLTVTAQFGPLRKFIESEPDAALRILWSGHGVVQRRLIDDARRMLEEAAEAGELELRLPADDLAYVMVRIGESFSWREWITGEDPDVPKAAAVVRMLLT